MSKFIRLIESFAFGHDGATPRSVLKPDRSAYMRCESFA